jgi:hypothetical protein
LTLPLPDWYAAIPEQVGSTSGGSAGFSHGGANVTRSYLMGASRLNDFIYYSLGYNARRADNKSGVFRQTPIADGQFPFLYCSSISQMQGNQYIQATDWEYYTLGADKFLSGQPMPTWAQYAEYAVSLNFDSRQYQVYDDQTLIDRETKISFIDSDNSVYVFPNVMPEWYRYTTYNFEVRSEFLTLDTGSAYYMAKDNPQINVGGTIGISAGTGMYKTLYKSGTFKVSWKAIPYFFATGIDVITQTNYLTANVVAQGKVNQEKFFGFKAGTLLCEGMTVDNIYNQAVVLAQDLIADNINANRYVFKENLLADVTFTFSYREDKSTEDYTTTKPTNRNTILYGHNLFLRGASGKSIAVIKGDDFDILTHKIKDNALGVTYASFPMQLLFTDPIYFSAIYNK